MKVLFSTLPRQVPRLTSRRSKWVGETDYAVPDSAQCPAKVFYEKKRLIVLIFACNKSYMLLQLSRIWAFLLNSYKWDGNLREHLLYEEHRSVVQMKDPIKFN